MNFTGQSNNKENTMTDFARFAGPVALALAGIVANGAHAQEYPSKGIRVIMPAPAGSGPDVDTRSVAAELSKVLKQTVLVENRPGASARIGMEAGAKATPDGYTLVVGSTTSLCTVPYLYPSVPYNVERDFVPVSMMVTLNTALLASPGVPASNARDLTAQLKAKPSSLIAGNFGVGSFQHLAGVWFENASGVKLNHVPYSTTAPFADLVGGQVQLLFDALPASFGNVQAGRLKILALTGKTRHRNFPDVPTFAESGVADYTPVAALGLLAPAGTPKAIVERLSAAVQKATTQNQTLIDKYHGYGGELRGTPPSEFRAFIKTESAKWGDVIRKANVRLD
jgi:tripartite-type tricarboxylate transporter receptor subunit TctC